ncbi:MAG TPA: c-type cytochrome [Planctomycetota bacterium]|nr:c-type cytochrome [Planctomycetota bacterium]
MPTPKKSSGLPEPTLHVLFALASLAMLATTVYTFYQDQFGREFPKYQELSRQVELDRLNAEKNKIWEEAKDPEVEAKDKELREDIKKAQAKLDSKKGEIDTLTAERRKIEDDLSIATTSLNAAKADYDQYKSDFDRGLKTKGDLIKQEALIAERATKQYDLKTKQDDADNKLAGLKGELALYQREQDALYSSAKDLRTKIRKTAGSPAINALKEGPGINFIDPLYPIKHLQLPNLKWSVFFADTLRDDRCITCHVSIDNPDPLYTDIGDARYTDEKDPHTGRNKKVLRSHPRLDLFVGANSKHPANKFGCTICHGGQPSALNFTRAAHSPQNAEQQNYWRAKYDWQPFESWDGKMLPLQHVEASCAKCHKGTDDVPEAAKLNEARHLFRDKGCVNCHMGNTGGSDTKWVGRVAPDLRRIGEKTNLDWARVWIENPWDFRPSTKMPRFFGLENRQDLKVDSGSNHYARDSVETEAIAEYIFMASQLREGTLTPPKEGNAEDGRKLYASVGCIGCHSTHDAGEKDKFELNQHGPDLSRIGEKVSAAWLYNWLKNPRHYWAETKMPNLRLSDDEAANLTSYLMSTMKSKEPLRKPEAYPTDTFETIIISKMEGTVPDIEVLKQRLKDPLAMVETALKSKVKYGTHRNDKGIDERFDTGDGEWTDEQIAKIKEVINNKPDKDRAAKLFLAGEMLIQHHGCYGCHNIQGWTYAPLTGVNLNGEADKDLDKFDFGHAGHDHSIPETKWDWFFAKVSRPRVFDRDKEDLIKPFDRLRMPWFGYRDKKDVVASEADSGENDNHARKYAPENNHDKSSPSPFVNGKHEVELLVTYLLSLTNEPIPGEMQRQPTAKDIALDHGRRVVRELNCTGCHTASVGSAATFNETRATLPLLAFIAMETPKAKAFIRSNSTNGIYCDEDLVSLDFVTNDVTMKGFLNIQRGTYLTPVTLPILFGEATTRTGANMPLEKLDFRLETKKKDGTWKSVTELITLDDYKKLTELFYEPKFDEKGARDYADATAGYNMLSKRYCDPKAFERVAGSAMLNLSSFKTDELKAERKFYEPFMLKVRLTRGEGRVMERLVDIEKDYFKNDNATFQNVPPTLSFEGGKIQPDWAYQFLHNVRPLRVGLNIRMPSFWTDGPYSAYKTIYPAGRLSAVDPAKREKGVKGEPLPGPDAVKVADVPDDAQQAVDFFVADAREKSYGGQPVLLDGDAEKKLYELGKKYVTELPPDDKNPGRIGKGCINCHSVGNFTQPTPKMAPNLANVKRRLKEDWVRRFINFPPSLYPWTNMPGNFIATWDYNHDFTSKTRGVMDEAKLAEEAQKLNAVKFFLMHSGDGELGSDIPPVPVAPPTTTATPPK